jgi:hypothetical protein
LMAVVRQVENRSVTEEQSTCFASVSNNSIVPEYTPIQPFPSYLISAICNFHNNTNAARVCIYYECKSQRVEQFWCKMEVHMVPKLTRQEEQLPSK